MGGEETVATLVNVDPAPLTFETLGLPATRLAGPPSICPLYVNDTTFIGLAWPLYHVDENRYTEDHRRLLERIAEQAGPVIHNSNRLRTVRRKIR